MKYKGVTTDRDISVEGRERDYRTGSKIRWLLHKTGGKGGGCAIASDGKGNVRQAE